MDQIKSFKFKQGGMPTEKPLLVKKTVSNPASWQAL